MWIALYAGHWECLRPQITLSADYSTTRRKVSNRSSEEITDDSSMTSFFMQIITFDHNNWDTTEGMKHNVGGFLNSIEQELGYMSLVKEVFKIDLPETLRTTFDKKVVCFYHTPLVMK